MNKYDYREKPIVITLLYLESQFSNYVIIRNNNSQIYQKNTMPH